MNSQMIEAHVNAFMYRIEHPTHMLYPCPAVPIISELKRKYAHIGNDYWDMYHAFEEEMFQEALTRNKRGLVSFYNRKYAH
jgi:hypothetical protein